MEGAASAIVEVEGLSKTYPSGVEAVRGVDFEIRAGEVFGLIGPNGAGKSTTIGMLTTTVAPTRGRARLCGFDVAVDPLRARRASAVVCQGPSVDRALSGRMNMEVHARLWGVSHRAARIAEVVDAFGLSGILERPVATYSGGQRRRLEIARALLSNPRVLFLDEPTVGLDPRIRRELLDMLGLLRSAEEMSVLVTTHYLDEAERLCDRVAIMYQGRLAASGSPAQLRARLGQSIAELRVEQDPVKALAVLRAGGVAGHDAFQVGQTVTVPVHRGSPDDAAAELARLGIAVTGVSTRPPTLDDVYLQLTGERIAA
ncbi:MAG TPA: ABC transporter ATP-binding protein [Acidimicrobiales bacterium]|nr:ABC transporter ATP-binding protein [Acidimicrobiales bacterium]